MISAVLFPIVTLREDCRIGYTAKPVLSTLGGGGWADPPEYSGGAVGPPSNSNRTGGIAGAVESLRDRIALRGASQR